MSQPFRRTIVIAAAFSLVLAVALSLSPRPVSAASNIPNTIEFDAFIEGTTAITVPLGTSFSLTSHLTATEISNLTINIVTDLQNMYWWASPTGQWYASGSTKSWVATNTATGQIRMVYNANHVGVHQISIQGGYLAGEVVNKVLTVTVTPPLPTCDDGSTVPSGEVRLIASGCTMEGNLSVGQTDLGPWTPLMAENITQAAVTVVLTDTWILADGNIELSHRDAFRDVAQQLLVTHDSVITSVVQEPTIITRKVLGKLQLIGNRTQIVFSSTYTTSISFDSCSNRGCFPGYFDLGAHEVVTMNSAGWGKFMFDSYWRVDHAKLKHWSCNTTSTFTCIPIPFKVFLPLSRK